MILAIVHVFFPLNDETKQYNMQILCTRTLRVILCFVTVKI